MRMVTQRIDPPKMDTKRFLLVLLQLFGAGILLVLVSKLLITLTGIGIFDVLFLAGAIALLFVLIRKTTLSYLYVADEDGGVRIAKCYGDKVNTLIELNGSDFQGVTRYEAGKNYKAQYRSVTVMAPKKRINAVLIYRQDGALHALLFAPDEEFLAALRAQKQKREEEHEKAE